MFHSGVITRKKGLLINIWLSSVCLLYKCIILAKLKSLVAVSSFFSLFPSPFIYVFFPSRSSGIRSRTVRWSCVRPRGWWSTAWRSSRRTTPADFCRWDAKQEKMFFFLLEATTPTFIPSRINEAEPEAKCFPEHQFQTFFSSWLLETKQRSQYSHINRIITHLIQRFFIYGYRTLKKIHMQ